MSKSLNKVMLIGIIGRDAETRFTTSGKSVSTFSMATDSQYSDNNGNIQKSVQWHSLKMWGGEKLTPYLTKGAKVYVEGRLETRSYEDKNGDKKYVTEIIVNAGDVVLLSSKQQDGQSQSRSASSDATGYAGNYDEQDAPF